MGNFNFTIDCLDAAAAESLKDFIEGVELYQYGLDNQREQITLTSKQGLIPELERYSKENDVKFSVVVYPEDQECDDAEESGDMDTYEFPSKVLEEKL